jgi:hypothetical protein
LGLAADGLPNEDKMGLHLVNLIRDRIGDIFLPYVRSHFQDEDDERVFLIRCWCEPDGEAVIMVWRIDRPGPATVLKF